MQTEKRFFEFRAARDGGPDAPVVIAGVAMPYGRKASIGKKFSEEFRAGAFTAGLDDAYVNLQHDRTKPVARVGHGLALDDSEARLSATITLPDTVYGREAAELVEARILQGMSVEFRAIDQEWTGGHRVVTEAHLIGIALVDRPAYSDAQIAKRFEEVFGHHAKSRVRYYY